MKQLSNLNKDERSLLLFFETAVVDYGGKLNTAHMNNVDMEIADRWTKEGFVTFSRIRLADISSDKTHAVFFSEDAWNLAHQERRARFNRMEEKRKWVTTAELKTT
jgi:hypothetical protein